MSTAFSGDTIAAIATAAGPGGVGIVRLSGPRAIEIVADALGVSTAEVDRTVRVGWVRGPAGERIDQVIAFAMRAPGSFTGEDVAELQGHGGAHNLERLLASVVARGARIAEPGEFTRRAVANHKLDLLRAEALLEVIHAGSERAWRLAQANLGGALGVEVEALEKRALAVLAELEGTIDFPEDDLETQTATWIAGELEMLRDRCGALAAGFRRGHAINHGLAVGLVGAVNVGKSSLVNALVGSERALVAAEPGTTRDWLEVQTAWNGIAITLIDTAGSRDTTDPVERRGIELGADRVASADVVIVVNDGRARWDDGSSYRERAVVVRSKVDLDNSTTRPGVDARAAYARSATTEQAVDALPTSATTGQGLDELRRRVLEVGGVADREGSEHALVTTSRQQSLMAAARDALAAAHATWDARRPPEIVAIELRQASQLLAQLRGVEVGDRVLDEVFARFCIGK